MAEKLDPRQVVTFEELLRAMMMEQDATRRVLVRKGLLTNEEVLEEIKAVRREILNSYRIIFIIRSLFCEDIQDDQSELIQVDS